MLEAKYTRLAEEIETKIASGDYPGKLPGVRSLAMAFGVSPTTIVKALKILHKKGILVGNGPSGTFVSVAGMRGRPRHGAIGVVGMSYQPEPKSEEFLEVENVALRFKCNTLAFNNTDPSVTQDPEFLSKMPVDGFIFAYSVLNKDIVLAMRRAGIPFVSCNRIDGIPDVSWVDYDNEQGLADVMRFLIKSGHKRVAYFGFHNPYNGFTDRMRAVYREETERAGVYDPALFFARHGYQELSVKYGAKTVDVYAAMAGDFLGSLATPPTAVYCHYAHYESLKRGLGKKGLELGSDVAVVVDAPTGVELAERVAALLLYPHTDRARMAAEMLFALINDLNAPARQARLKRALVIDKQQEENPS